MLNTGIDSILEQLCLGRPGAWARTTTEGRCLVPMQTLCEGHMTEKVESNRVGRPIRHQRPFCLPGDRAFPLAAVREGNRFSIVTTVPNASVVPVHDRMPLVLGPGESSVWLGPDFATLADRSALRLDSEPEA